MSHSSPEKGSIRTSLQESRVFDPPPAFAKKAHISSLDDYERMWRESVDYPEEFWGREARARLKWEKPFTSVLNWQEPHARWFEDGELNASVQCLDRHLAARGEKTALIWEGEPGDQRKLSYQDLYEEVCMTAHALERSGVRAGDRVMISLPLVPELVISVLACARIGAVHSVIFGGFGPDSIADRVKDAHAKIIITADGGFRKGTTVDLKRIVDAALEQVEGVKTVVVLKRSKRACQLKAGRDVSWDDWRQGCQKTHEFKAFPSEQPLFILYTSGSTGKPKGVLHTTAGYLLAANLSTQYVFDLKEEDVYWCTADVGWITGHSYVVYGPLSLGATVMLYEGAPQSPDWGRFWQMIERYKVSIFYTAPTAIRSFMKAGEEWPRKYDLTSLRLLGTVGEPINPEAWMWYRRVIGADRCPIVDTWWQTETGSIMITPLPGATPTIPGTATRPFFGIKPEIVDSEGIEVPQGEGGYLVIAKPWPSMLRTIYGNDERYRAAYWSTIKGKYFTGDGARIDQHGNFWILGRVDDVLNVSGHRLSTMEVESALVSHPSVAEAAVVGFPHEIKGEGICAFVTLRSGISFQKNLEDELKQHVAKHLGAVARPDQLRSTDQLPKTRSGKIMRRLLRDIAAGRSSSQDTSTLEDQSILERLKT